MTADIKRRAPERQSRKENNVEEVNDEVKTKDIIWMLCYGAGYDR